MTFAHLNTHLIAKMDRHTADLAALAERVKAHGERLDACLRELRGTPNPELEQAA